MAFQGRTHKAGEQRVRTGRLRFEFRMILHAHKPGVRGNFHDFHQSAVRAGAHHLHAAVDELLSVEIIELVAMPMAFGDIERSVAGGGTAAGSEAGRLGAQPHRAPFVGDGALLVE